MEISVKTRGNIYLASYPEDELVWSTVTYYLVSGMLEKTNQSFRTMERSHDKGFICLVL